MALSAKLYSVLDYFKKYHSYQLQKPGIKTLTLISMGLFLSAIIFSIDNQWSHFLLTSLQTLLILVLMLAFLLSRHVDKLVEHYRSLYFSKLNGFFYTEGFFTYKHNFIHKTVFWRDVKKVKETKNHFIFHINKTLILPVAKKDFASSKQILAIRDLIQQRFNQSEQGLSICHG